jgi:hypothetical protein
MKRASNWHEDEHDSEGGSIDRLLRQSRFLGLRGRLSEGVNRMC